MVEPLVRLLGPVQYVDSDGSVVELPSVSLRRLLGVLAVSGDQTLRAEYLVELLDLSRGALRTSLSRLRSRIGERAIHTEGAGYHLRCDVDSVRFTALLGDRDHPDPLSRIEEALALWRGSAIEEFRHEAWAEADAARLDELRLVALEDRAELLIARGRSGEAVAALEAHVAANPMRDRPRGLLMEALAGDGRQADALRVFQQYRGFLADETGTEPSPHVQSIDLRVAARWRELDLSSDARLRTTRVGGWRERTRIEIPLARAIEQAAPLIGRTRELAALEAELALARGGELRAVRLSGDAGIGKTTLLAAFARAPRGSSAAMLYGRCDEVSVPLQPFRSIVRTVVEHAPLPVIREHAELHGGELLRLAPHLRSRTWVPDPIEGGDAIERFHLFEAIADLLRRVAAARPITLVLDDLHWAEPATLVLMRHLVRSLVGSPALVVASYRGAGDELPAGVRAALTDLDRAPIRRLELRGLDDAELAELATSLVGTDHAGSDSIAVLRQQTAGNPLRASQLLLHLRERRGPTRDLAT